MIESQNRYNQRGVSSSKEEVHRVVDNMDRGLFPGAFCKITSDSLTGQENFAMSFILMGQGPSLFSVICGIVKLEMPLYSKE